MYLTGNMFHLTPCYATFEIRNQWLYSKVTGLDIDLYR